MLQTLLLDILNRTLAANPKAQHSLQKLAAKNISLVMPLVYINFVITTNGLLEATTSDPDCEITIPIAILSHLIHHNQHKTLQLLKIKGDREAAIDLFKILATLELDNLVYYSQLPGANSLPLAQLHKLSQSLIKYAQLVITNASLSTSHYLQHEKEWIVNQHELEQFYNHVDNLNEACDRLAYRLERLSINL